MKSTHIRYFELDQRGQRGISLIIVLILMVVIGLTSVAAMRGATSGQRLTNNVRAENVAQQYAEAALRYCETELQRPDPAIAGGQARPNSLLRASIIKRDMNVVGTTPVWESLVAWNGPAGVGDAISRTTLNTAQYSTAGSSSYSPGKPPECIAEVQTLGGGTPFNVTVVTARGFSSDYRADNAGNTIQGSVVWLQSILNMCAGTLPCP
jgi:type IV pilus assembly protein PilX